VLTADKLPKKNEEKIHIVIIDLTN